MINHARNFEQQALSVDQHKDLERQSMIEKRVIEADINYVDRELEKLHLKSSLNRRGLEVQKMQMKEKEVLNREASEEKKNELN